ncbi:MAG: hypothetical protein HY779_06055 [Rubrobacteridae bacterium]|nr:hypothetical protein [Rubrobacteridae bacterium]
MLEPILEMIVVTGCVAALIYSFLQFRSYTKTTPSSYENNSITPAIVMIITLLSYTGLIYALLGSLNIATVRIMFVLTLFLTSLCVLVLAYHARNELKKTAIHHRAEIEQIEFQEQGDCIESEAPRQTEVFKEVSTPNSVTELFDTQHLYRKLGEEIIRAKRQRIPLYLMMFDITHAKPNCELSRTVGTVIRDSIRNKIDSGFECENKRYAVVLPHTAKEPAIAIAKRILSGLNNHGISVGAGLVSCNEIGGNDAFELIRIAGIAVGEAKSEGSNRIRLLEKNRFKLTDDSYLKHKVKPKHKKIRHLRRLK